MAAVDGLLSLLIAQGADTLTLAEGQVPQLTKAGEPKPLSMPPLLPELVGRFIEEVRATGDGATYVLDGKGGRTAFEVEIDEPSQLRFRRADAAPPSAASATVVGSAASAAPSATSAVTSSMSATTAAAVAPARSTPGATPALDGNVAVAGATSSAGAAAAHTPRTTGLLADDVVAAAQIDGVVLDLIHRALDAEATDLFVSTSSDARMRVDMTLHELPHSRLGEDALLALIGLGEAQHERLERHGSVDLGLHVHDTKVRVNLFRHRGGLAAAIRPLRRVRSLAELSLPPDLEKLTEPPDGLVLLVGPTGSGKSSTLAALLDQLNHTRSRHILTIEDPVEFEYESGRCLIHQREVGRDVESFAAGLRAALRESPDVILVGEMRDAETFAAALTAAETGHLVFSTLHSGSASMAIDRIIDSFPPHQQMQVRLQLASVLRFVVTQVLLPSVQPGRLVPAIERMAVTHAIAHKIRDGRGHQIGDDIHTGRADGMVSLDTSLAELVRRGQITLATARGAARNPELLREMLA